MLSYEPTGVQTQSFHISSILHNNFHWYIEIPMHKSRFPLNLGNYFVTVKVFDCHIHTSVWSLCVQIYFIHWHVVRISFLTMNCSFGQDDSMFACVCVCVCDRNFVTNPFSFVQTYAFQTLETISLQHYTQFLDARYKTEMKTETLFNVQFPKLNSTKQIQKPHFILLKMLYSDLYNFNRHTRRNK